MPNITLRLSKKQRDEINKLASDSQMTINDYIIRELLSAEESEDKTIRVTDIIEKALKVAPGTEFNIPSLFPIEEWNNINNTTRRIASRTFMKLIKDEDNSLADEFSSLGKKSNLATFKRL
jgi:hypothetical protein